MTDLTLYDSDDSSNRFERIERSSVIEPGHHWRCIREVQGIEVKQERNKFKFVEGHMYLLTRLEFFDGKLHSVVLLDDPQFGTSSGILTLGLFLQSFEQVEAAVALEIRNQQIAAVQADAADIQKELAEAQVNPALMQQDVEEGLRAWERELAREKANREGEDEPSAPKANLPTITTNGRFDLTSAIEHKISSTDIDVFRHMAQREGKIAEIRGKWLSKKVEELGRTLKKLTPFFSEHAAIGMARAHDAQELSKDVEKGLRSLRLYTGEGVEVVTLLTGKSAPPDEPLTIFQSKLYMDEEYAVWDNVDRLFDYTNSGTFFKALAENEALRNQLIPAARGVVGMAVRRTDAKYSVDSIESAMSAISKNYANKALFLLVRDGENWYQVFSDEPSHELSSRLFPTRNEMDQVFQGYDGEKVGFEDLRFTNRTNEFDRKSLVYKRFLILACGLDHNKKLFGHFYPENEALNFISLGFQSKYMRFVADDDSDVMLGDNLGSVHEVIRHNHSQLAAGCRVLVFGKEVLEQGAAPGAFSKGRYQGSTGKNHYSLLVKPQQKAVLLTVYRDKDDLVVHLPVRRINDEVYKGYLGYQPVERPEFNVKVALNKLSGDKLGYLITDTLRAEELRPYIYSRRTRAHHWDYLYGFKLAMQIMGAEEAENAPVLRQLRERATTSFGLNQSAAEIATTSAVQSWRLKNPKEDRLPSLNSEGFDKLEFELAEAAYAFTHAIPQIQAYIDKLGGKLIRVMRGKKGVLVAYYEQPDTEKDLRIKNWLWVGRRTFTPAGKPSKDAPQTVELLAGRIIGETELMRVESPLVHRLSSRLQLERIISLLDMTSEMAEILVDAFKGERHGVSDRAWLALMAPNKSAREELARGREVEFERGHVVLLPIGVDTKYQTVLGIRVKVYDLLYHYGSDAQRAALLNQGYTLPKPKKDYEGNVIPYEGVELRPYVDSHAYPAQYTGPVGNEVRISSSNEYRVFDFTYKGERWVDHSLTWALAQKEPENKDIWDHSRYLHPETLWIPAQYRDENGEFQVSRFFPGLKTA